MTSGGRRERADRRGSATRGSARPRRPGVGGERLRTVRSGTLGVSAARQGRGLDPEDLTTDDQVADESADAALTETGEQPVTRTSRVSRAPRRSIASTVLTQWERVDPKRAIVLALVLSVVALTLAMPVRTYFSQRSEFEQLRASNAQLSRDVADYQRKVNEQGDPAYVEAKARERLQMVRPGDKAVVMMFPGDDARVAAEKRAEAKARNPWYGNLWDAVATPPKTK